MRTESFEEINHLLDIGHEGLVTHSDAQAMNNNIHEWFCNPEGSIADEPAWGSNIAHFLFSSQTEDEAVFLEMAIAEKLSRDVRGINITGIKVEFVSIDSCSITVIHQYGVFEGQL